MKIPPSDIKCVEVKGATVTHRYLFRAYSKEYDSLKKENGIFHARGLLFVTGGEWTPGWFYFRESKAKLMPPVVDPDWLLPWFIAGIMLGERFNPYGGRCADYDHAVDLWRYWAYWQLGDREYLLPNECAQHLKTTPGAVRAQLSRLGLSAEPQ